ncbi:hypothetical protein D1BOALGB6SA_4626 [Olavius sp. associated proteobacterium Delta 1]|nr:hypothetical protein D1BOALGB6SA_4626 [Olavius sp. associated proteobacterium Delta 1]
MFYSSNSSKIIFAFAMFLVWLDLSPPASKIMTELLLIV